MDFPGRPYTCNFSCANSEIRPIISLDSYSIQSDRTRWEKTVAKQHVKSVWPDYSLSEAARS